MNILWITNSPLPEPLQKLGLKAPVTVGWVHSAAKAIREEYKEIKLGIASFYKKDDLKKIETDGIIHYLIPGRDRYKINNSRNKELWQKIKNEFNPDVIHIHGSEYPHSYEFVESCGTKNVVVSIQGMVSVYERYYFGSINKNKLKLSTTIRDIIRFDTIFSQHRDMRKRGFYERLLLAKVNHVIGRTGWDKAHTWAINPKVSYHFCNETLRNSFYNNNWDIKKCERHSIFISQAQYPIKGFHQLLLALPIVLRHFPGSKVYVAGHNFFSNRGIKLHGFGRYINTLIRKYNLSSRISFLGLLSEKEMCERFLNSNVSVCPSAIENSPNSVGEAQLLGVPCIASYVGGTADMIEHEKSGLLYRFEEFEMLAENICKVFADDNFAQMLSENEKKVASVRHNKENNAHGLIKIYKTISDEN